MKSRTKQIIISIILILLSYGYIIFKIANLKKLNDLTFSSEYNTYLYLLIFLIVILLMVLNWGLETIKWKILIDKIQRLNFIQALQAVFSGITVGIFTPNRLGEIGGRVFFLEKGKRTYGVLATGIGSFAQFITTIATGFFGFILFLFLFPDKTIPTLLFNKITATGLLIILLISIWIYFNIRRINPILLKISFFKTRIDQLEYLSKTNSSSLLKVLLLSLARYIVFTSQFFLLLIFFNIHLTIVQSYISISLIYLFATLIPTTTLVELGIRASLSIFFIGMFSNNIIGIVMTTSFLWFINIAVPSVIGSIFFVKKNFDK